MDDSIEFEKVVLLGGKPWGFVLNGGSEYNLPFTIKDVTGEKARQANLKKGDAIIEINGSKLSGLKHEQAKQMIINSGNSLTLLIKKNNTIRLTPTPPKVSLSHSEPSTKQIQSEPPKPIAPEPVKTPKIVAPATEIQVPIRDSGVEYSDAGLSKVSDIKSPFLKNLIGSYDGESYPEAIPKHSSGGSNITHIEPATTIVMPAAPAPAKSRGIGKSIPPPVKKELIIEKPSPSKTTDNTPVVKDNDSVKVCHHCEKAILDGVVVMANDVNWHRSHFNCQGCNVNLVDKQYFESGSKYPFCNTCHLKKGTSTVSCTECSKAIVSEYVTVGETSIHKNCFLCSICKKSLLNVSFSRKDGKFICQECRLEVDNNKCNKCNGHIVPGQSYLNFDGKDIHSSCFKCEECNKVLSKFKMRGGSPICPEH